MAAPYSSTVTADKRVVVGLGSLGILSAIAAAYYAGETGNLMPLLLISMCLCLFALFIESE